MSATDQPDDFASVRRTLSDYRREGAPFPLAWSRAIEVVPPAEGRTAEAADRRRTRDALLGTRAAWQSAYERRPVRVNA
jgi:hypothetical protein